MARANHEAQIRKTIVGLERVVERQMIRIAISIHTQLVRNTPVDTGWARMNWIPSIGTPSPGPVGSRQSARPNRQASVAHLLVYKFNQGSIWIRNAVPYIQVLNAGHSKQAAAGWVEASITAGIGAVATS